MLDIVQFITEKGIQRIDLMKINIEGEEFNLLPRLLDSSLVQICRNLQIQFHDFVENSEILRKNMRSELEKTHHMTYDYFIWENWELN